MNITSYYRKSGLLILTLISTLILSEIILDADLVKTDVLQLNNIKADTLFMSDSILVDGFTMDFNDYFLHSTPVLSSDTEYSMTISGNYKLSSTSGLDAAYIYCYFECLPCSISEPCDIANPDYRIIDSLLRPVIDTFNLAHYYYYSFMGADTAMVFEFDDAGNYGDNGGSLDINIYEPTSNPYIQIDSSEIYMSSIGSGIVMRSPNGACWKLQVDDTGNVSAIAISCPE